MQDIAIYLVSNLETHARTYEQLVPCCKYVCVCESVSVSLEYFYGASDMTPRFVSVRKLKPQTTC